MRRNFSWSAIFASLGGFLLGFAITRLPSSHVGWSIAYIVLGGLASWIVIPLSPHGSFNLSPMVFLVVALTSGVWEGVAVAVAGPVIAACWNALFLPSRWRRPLAEVLSDGGEAGVALVAASASVWFLGGWKLELERVTLLFAACLLVIVALQAVRISVAKRIRLGRVAALLYRASAAHQGALFLAVGLAWAIVEMIGPLGILLTTIVVIEMYYPWKLLGEQRDLFLKSLQMISNAVDLKDPYTAYHSRRVAEYSAMMAREIGVDEAEVERIRIGALMHDIGKVAVPSALIRKPSKLTEEEMNLMKTHVEAGASVIEGLEILNRSADIVRHHHENYDGSGYPSGLKGRDIPFGARIVFVADAFDALTTDRPYRKGRSPGEALRILEANSNTQFDPIAVKALGSVIRHGL
jgi:putative nucleotidyltransferase with HDIG domain